MKINELIEEASKLKKGDIFHLAQVGGGVKFYKCHVLEIVEKMIVFRWYGSHKQWWHYEIDSVRSVAGRLSTYYHFKNKAK